ncbi:hypothetical protein NDU88_006059 [Pleurodeles waltl]|uniref:Uncharacterized protein n=1 Tax=Pleurodeles waltl TaxID=8319 RepID=A0AAV7MEQ1_PLEWA|nr:hypothetical protein NDU88_006059 [Pleurodeles waltl]
MSGTKGHEGGELKQGKAQLPLGPNRYQCLAKVDESTSDEGLRMEDRNEDHEQLACETSSILVTLDVDKDIKGYQDNLVATMEEHRKPVQPLQNVASAESRALQARYLREIGHGFHKGPNARPGEDQRRYLRRGRARVPEETQCKAVRRSKQVSQVFVLKSGELRLFLVPGKELLPATAKLLLQRRCGRNTATSRAVFLRQSDACLPGAV